MTKCIFRGIYLVFFLVFAHLPGQAAANTQTGPCIEGAGWFVSRYDTIVSATFAPCEAPYEGYVSLSCDRRVGLMRFAANAVVDAYPGRPVDAFVLVDGERIAVAGQGMYNDYLGATSFEAFLRVGHALPDALSAGREASLMLPNGGVLTMHLAGSRNAIARVVDACSGR